MLFIITPCWRIHKIPTNWLKLYRKLLAGILQSGRTFFPASQSKLGLCELFENFQISFQRIREHFYPVTLSKPENQVQNKLYIASDVDCRGIDIPELSYVIILDLPSSIDKFIHMSGRVGRIGLANSGNVYTTPWNAWRFQSIHISA